MINQATRARILQRVFWSPLGVRVIKVVSAIGRRWSVIVMNRSVLQNTNGELWLSKLLPAQPLVVDVGFHRGEFAHSVLQDRPAARIVGFEPASSMRDLYESLHPPDPRITVESVALSDAAGEFLFNDDASGLNSLAPIEYSERTVSYAVTTTTLDAYVLTAGLGHIDLLKIDVEGYDLQVLEGASEALRRQAIGMFLFEYNSPWVLSRRYLKDAYDYFSDKPYRLFRLYNGFLSPFTYSYSAERFDLGTMYVGVSEQRLAQGDIPIRAFPT